MSLQPLEEARSVRCIWEQLAVVLALGVSEGATHASPESPVGKVDGIHLMA